MKLRVDHYSVANIDFPILDSLCLYIDWCTQWTCAPTFAS